MRLHIVPIILEKVMKGTVAWIHLNYFQITDYIGYVFNYRKCVGPLLCSFTESEIGRIMLSLFLIDKTYFELSSVYIYNQRRHASSERTITKVVSDKQVSPNVEYLLIY